MIRDKISDIPWRPAEDSLDLVGRRTVNVIAVCCSAFSTS
jgi:hypothetical protein